ncbi:MAG: TolC family outer membrane protein [Gammaproteobacteria bacterium SHHR-1]
MKKLLALILLLPLTGVQGADLMQLYQMALESDPILRGARSSRNAVSESRVQARAALLPSIGLGAEASRTWRSRPNPDETYNSSAVSLNLTQSLLRFDQWIALKKTAYQIDQAEAEYSYQELDLMVRVAQAYFDILSARDNLSFAQAELRAISRQLDQAKQRFDVGLIAITDVHEVQAAYDQAKANEIAAINLLDNSWEGLRVIVAELNDRSIPVLRERIPMSKPSPASIEEWVSTALEQNPQILAAVNAVSSARKDIELQRSGHLPSLELTASVANSETDSRTGFDADSSSIGLQLSLPIYAGGGVSSRTRQARHQFQVSTEELERVRRSVRRNVSDYYRGVLSSISQIQALESATRSAQSALEATQAGFDVGTRTMVDVLSVQRNLYNARRNYAKARYDYILNGLRLKQAAGILRIEDLRLINGLLQGRS